MAPPHPSYSLVPMFGLGSYNRIAGSGTISSPRTRIGSANRVYQFMKNTVGTFAAANYIQTAAFGPYRIYKGRFVWN